jgi:hypothetical protein
MSLRESMGVSSAPASEYLKISGEPTAQVLAVVQTLLTLNNNNNAIAHFINKSVECLALLKAGCLFIFGIFFPYREKWFTDRDTRVKPEYIPTDNVEIE